MRERPIVSTDIPLLKRTRITRMAANEETALPITENGIGSHVRRDHNVFPADAD